MPVAKPLLPYVTPAVADLRPRSISYEADIGSILGGIFGALAVLVALVIGIWQIVRSIRDDERHQEEVQRLQEETQWWRQEFSREQQRRQLENQRHYNRWHRKLRRMLGLGGQLDGYPQHLP